MEEIKKSKKYIDIHTHGAYGVDFNSASYDEVKILLKKLYTEGLRGICPTLVGDCDENILRQLKLFRQIKKEQMSTAPKETLILGVHLEGTFLNPEKSGIQDPKYFKKPTVENFQNLTQEFEDMVKIVTIAPELDCGLISYLNERNIIAQAGHTKGSEIKGCRGTTHIFNAMNPLHHRNPSIALEALVRDDIYIEVIGDMVHLSKDIIKLILKTKPKNRIILISDSLPCAGANREIVFCGKKINPEGKDKRGTLAGSALTLDKICQKLKDNNILTDEDIETLAFKNQIEYLKLKQEEITILKG